MVNCLSEEFCPNFHTNFWLLLDALTDGLLTLRYLFGLQGDTLINGVVAGDATRKTAEEIEAHLETLMPAL